MVGSVFIYPLLHVSPTGVVPSQAPGAAAMIARKLDRRRTRVSPPPTPSWPMLSKLKHPAAYLLGSQGRPDKQSESGAESEEFERILASDSEEEDDRRLAQLFGKPRRRTGSSNV